MHTKSRWLLGLACAAMIIVLARVAVGDGVADFAAGLAAAFLVGVLVSWRARRVP